MRFVGDDSAKFQFEFTILSLAPTLEENMDCPALLSIAHKAATQALQAEMERHLVRIPGVCILHPKTFLEDHGSVDVHRQFGHYLRKFTNELFAMTGISQAIKRWCFLPNIAFVQNDRIVTKVAKFETPHIRFDLSRVNYLLKDCEYQGENWELWVNARQAVIAALVCEYDVI